MQRLPEVQQLVRSLAVENESLLEVRNIILILYLPTSILQMLTGFGICFGLEQEMRALKRACSALSKENDKLEVNICLLILFSSVPNWHVGH
jgi:hypothetical protein